LLKYLEVTLQAGVSKSEKPIAAAAGTFLVEMLPSSFAFFPAIPIRCKGKIEKHNSFLVGLYAG
jgi:hypothetical protein